LLLSPAKAQITERPRPAEWQYLVNGGRFMDRFLPMPEGKLSSDVWGASDVRPRYVDNGIEDGKTSYWGGNILKTNDGKYHLFVCGWPESSPKGHATWSKSTVYHATGDCLSGPFLAADTIGAGHNPEAFVLSDGRIVIYVIDGYYIANSVTGPWIYGRFDFDPRDRKVIAGLSNLTFARRQDGSYLMICRGGGVWVSRDGISTYSLLTDKSVYPNVQGRFEDPLIWRDSVQYHLIVNDWLGRIAYYQRSKDGVRWITEPGEAYMPGVSLHKDGRVENWFKCERIKIFQDEYGRAVQANFAVIDTLKNADKANDNHSSKNICIPLNPGLRLAMPDSQPITPAAETIRLRIFAEKGFNPHTDIDIPSLRFGASSEVNFGRGCKVKTVEKSGADLMVTFAAAGHGITEEEFALKLIGKTTVGALLYGYVRLPYVNSVEPMLSARKPIFTPRSQGVDMAVEVENFGLAASRTTTLKVSVAKDGGQIEIGSASVPALKAYEKATVTLSGNQIFEKDKEYSFRITIYSGDREHSTFAFKANVF
jgi:hypothetical protein